MTSVETSIIAVYNRVSPPCNRTERPPLTKMPRTAPVRPSFEITSGIMQDFLAKDQHSRSLIWHLLGLFFTVVATIYTILSRPQWIRSAIQRYIPWYIIWLLNVLMIIFNFIFVRYWQSMFAGMPLSKRRRALHHILNIVHLCMSPRWIYVLYTVLLWQTSSSTLYSVAGQLIRLWILDAPVLIFNLLHAARIAACQPRWALAWFLTFVAPQAIFFEVLNYIKYVFKSLLWVTVRWYPGVNRVEGEKQDFPWDLLRASLWNVLKRIGRQIIGSGEYAVGA